MSVSQALRQELSDSLLEQTRSFLANTWPNFGVFGPKCGLSFTDGDDDDDEYEDDDGDDDDDNDDDDEGKKQVG